MRRFLTFLAVAWAIASSAPAQLGPSPDSRAIAGEIVRTTPRSNIAGDCAKFVSPNRVTDAGAACGGVALSTGTNGQFLQIQAPNGNSGTFNTSGGGVSLSNGNRDAAAPSTAGAALGAQNMASGKWYFELKVLAVGSGYPGLEVGFATSALSLTTADMTHTSNAVGVQQDGALAANGSNIGGGPGGPAVGDVIRFAVDVGASKVWVAKNGGTWNASGTANPATASGGIVFSITGAGGYYTAYSSNGSNSHVSLQTANTYPAPAGFSSITAGAASSAVWASGYIPLNTTTVSGLSTLDPTPTAGDRATVSDATACTFGSAVTGGGSTLCPVVYNGSSWLAG